MFKDKLGDSLAPGSLGFFKGANEVPLYSSDFIYPEYQEASFYYLFGAVEMDCYGVIDFENETAVLFVPRMDDMVKIWMTVLSIEEYKEKYNLVD